MAKTALVGARLFDGTSFLEDHALVLDADRIMAVVPMSDYAEGSREDIETIRLDGGLLAPGFIDAQVNGGGGVMLNDDPSPETMYAILNGHRTFGTTSIMPTLITDADALRDRAIAAKPQAVLAGRGVAGLHLEGPHLAPARKGTHLAKYMRPLTDADVTLYSEAASSAGRLLLTVAAEQVTPDQVTALNEAGVLVSIGHSDTDADTATRLFRAGARGVTHLFNAMSGLSHRAPGLVGAALDSPMAWAGIIADGHHVDPAALRIAIRSKAHGQGKLFFVTDSMSLVGQEEDRLQLNGRTIYRSRSGFCPRLTLEDGTLAGSDLDMASAVRFGVAYLELDLAEALRMATAYPADYLRLEDRGRLSVGLRADLVHLDYDLQVKQTWLGGRSASEAA
ncbi:N-acetylglucosamine-6-phosphate deacetylase [Cohaesibacter sp. ES.047]|nr:N-acetylglucosamine-6-phosphate deacetylase [Cohaesibacter sp. ES.047]